MCGTCKYCLAFFQAAGAFAAAVLIAASSLYIVFGGTPPVFTMAIGFWILFVTSFTALYTSIFLVRVVGEGLFASWTSKYILVLMIFMVVCYFASAILFFIPITEGRMMLYSRYHIQRYDKIPPFLDTIQLKFECCGIYDYKDYYDRRRLGRGIKEKRIFAVILPTDPKWYLVQNLNTKNNAPDGQTIHKDLKKVIKVTVFNTSLSCCPRKRSFVDKYCFVDVELGNNIERNKISAKEKVNNPELGCFKKYESILNLSGTTYQLPWLMRIIQWGSLLQSIEWFLLIWVFRLTIRALVQHGVSDPFEEPIAVRPEADLDFELKFYDEQEGAGEEDLMEAEVSAESVQNAQMIKNRNNSGLALSSTTAKTENEAPKQKLK